MARTKILSDTAVIVSSIKAEDMKVAQALKPELLKLPEEEFQIRFSETKNAGNPVNKYGITFDSVDDKGRAAVTVRLNKTDEDAANTFLHQYGNAFMKLEMVENIFHDGFTVLSGALESARNSITICD